MGKERMCKDEQLLPISIGSKILAVLEQQIAKVLDPVYVKLDKEVEAIKDAVLADKRKAITTLEGFTALTGKLAEAIVSGTHFDPHGLKVSKDIYAQFDKIDAAGVKKIAKLREDVTATEAKVNAWRKSVQVDLELCLTIPDQRVVLAKVLESNPLEDYAMEAAIATPATDIEG